MSEVSLDNIKVDPLGDRVLVKPSTAEFQEKSGLIIHNMAQEKPQYGVVVNVGPGTRLKNGTLEPLEVKIGDKILYGKYAGIEITLDKVIHMLINQDEILGVLTEG